MKNNLMRIPQKEPCIPLEIINSVIDIKLTIEIMKELLVVRQCSYSHIESLSSNTSIFLNTIDTLEIMNFIKYTNNIVSITKSGLIAAICAETLTLSLNNKICLEDYILGKYLTNYKTVEEYYIDTISSGLIT